VTDISFAITGDNASFLRALNESKTALQTASAEMKEGFEGVAGVFEKITGSLGVLTAVLGGGSMFKEAIEATSELEKGSAKLGTQLGISATEGSYLRQALDEIYMSSEDFQAVSAAMVRQLRQHEQSFNDVGIATRDLATGGYRPMLDIMLDVNKHLNDVKAGTDRNIEGQRLYGKSFMDNQRIIKLTGDAMEKGKEQATELGLVVTKQSSEQFGQYRHAMQEVHDVNEGVWNAIGQQLLPTLTQLGELFAEYGPTFVRGFSLAMAEVVTVLATLKIAANVIWDSLALTFNGIYELLAGFANSIGDLLPSIDWENKTIKWGDLTKAKQSFQAGWDNMQRIGREGVAKIIADSKAGADEIALAWRRGNGTAPATPTPNPGGTGNASDDTSKINRVQRWQTELEELKVSLAAQGAAVGEFHEFSKAQEVEYWQKILDTQNVNQREQLELRGKIAQAGIAVAKQQMDAELASYKTAEAAQRQNLDAKLTIAQAYAARVATAYGTDSRQYSEAAREIVAIEQAKQEQLLQLNEIAHQTAERMSLASVDEQESNAQQLVTMGLITQGQLLAQEQQFETQRHQIRAQALAANLALIDPIRDPVKYSQANALIEAEETQHQTKLNKIRGAAAVDSAKYVKAGADQMASSWAQTLTRMAEGQESFSNGVRDLFAGMVDAFIQQVAQMVAQWAAMQLANLVLGRATAEGQVGSAAAVAGAMGTASFAAAPWPIDLGAPAFGAAMAAAAGSFAVAERGYDVPAGVNPMTQLHAEEMVLPKGLANAVRDMAGGGAQQAAPTRSSRSTLDVQHVGGGFGLIHMGNLADAIKQLGLQFKMPHQSAMGAGLT
jgi:hypothetical protein